MAVIHCIGGPEAGTFEVPQGLTLTHNMWFPRGVNREYQTKYEYTGRRGPASEYIFEHVDIRAYRMHLDRHGRFIEYA